MKQFMLIRSQMSILMGITLFLMTSMLGLIIYQFEEISTAYQDTLSTLLMRTTSLQKSQDSFNQSITALHKYITYYDKKYAADTLKLLRQSQEAIQISGTAITASENTQPWINLQSAICMYQEDIQRSLPLQSANKPLSAASLLAAERNMDNAAALFAAARTAQNDFFQQRIDQLSAQRSAMFKIGVSFSVFTIITMLALFLWYSRQLNDHRNILEKLSFIDGLTNISNRRHFDEAINREWKRALTYNDFISIILIDIDFFKQYNDFYGHLQGDECLRTVANALKKSLARSGSMAARYGGEEFVILLPSTPQSEAVKVAEKIKEEIELLKIVHPLSNVHYYLTVSMGIAALRPKSTLNPTDLLAKADSMLYKAKKEGRNKIAVIEPNFPIRKSSHK
ncbi:MAG: diguanylate cyclase [Veillonellales bacterium]